jgi:hypothetical protein
MAYRDIPIQRGSNVDTVQYDPSTGTLRVTFQRQGAAAYLYQGVPGTVADGFTTSGMSAGKYLNIYIKDQYPFERG